MNNISYGDVIAYYLKKDYREKSLLLNNLSSHIDNLYDNFVLTTDDKKKINILISDTINNLNNYYNNNSSNISNTKYFCSETDFNFFIETIDILKDSNCIDDYYSNLKLFNYKDINLLIKKICNYIGLSNINEILNIYGFNDKVLDLNHEDNDKLNLLKEIFVPFNSKYYDDKRLDKKNKHFEFSLKKNLDDKYNLLLGNVYQIKFRINRFKTVLEINGFIKQDSVNSLIRTSQLVHSYLYNKKKYISEEIDKIQDLDNNFKQSYVKNLSNGEILLFDDNTIKKKINEDYLKYVKYSNMIFKGVMNEFIHSDIITKFEIIRYLLMGSSTSINIAALLFGITKDQKESIDNNSKPTLISDLIYKNLKFVSQVKLKKSDTIILQELEKISSINLNDIDLKKQIITNKSMPDYVKKIALQKIEEIKSGSSENYKHIDYVKTLIDYPWINKNYTDIFSTLNTDLETSKNFIEEAKTKMNNAIYGHPKCKETIIELIAKWISNPKSIGKCIGLHGPPGVGKTLFGKALGNILGIPFAQINVGGIDDASVLSGHSFTYSNAQPGLIIRKMIQAGSPRCIIFIDEVDKTGIKYGINEIMNILIHITDPNTNDNFNDKFFQEVTFPLSKVLFIFSYNDQSKIDKILLDRIEQINVEAYSTHDKVNIFNNYLLKEICSEINIPHDKIDINDKSIEHLIETYTYEAGVRSLKRKLEKVLLKINLDRIYSINNYNDRILLDIDLIDKILDKTNINIKKILPKPYIGIINGLYATDSGIGGVLPILIYKNCNGTNKFKLKTTGSQKTVMKESINFSFTIATNILKSEIVYNFIKNNPDGLHIHTPDGATPKDGPSAGAAFTTAFISKILNLPIKNNIAMTGEIETNGAITAIGGLESKLYGAKKAGVELVFIPKENEHDYNKIIKKNNNIIDKNFNIIIVKDIYDVLQYALIDTNKKYAVGDKTFDCSKYFNVL